GTRSTIRSAWSEESFLLFPAEPSVLRRIGTTTLLLPAARAGILSTTMSVQRDPTDRRRSERMLIDRDVAYRVLNLNQPDGDNRGKTLNMSSSGVLFTTHQALVPGKRLELSIDWPVQLDNKCALKLVARGRVVRFEGDRAALEILQHEFR